MDINTKGINEEVIETLESYGMETFPLINEKTLISIEGNYKIVLSVLHENKDMFIKLDLFNLKNNHFLVAYKIRSEGRTWKEHRNYFLEQLKYLFKEQIIIQKGGI